MEHEKAGGRGWLPASSIFPMFSGLVLESARVGAVPVLVSLSKVNFLHLVVDGVHKNERIYRFQKPVLPCRPLHGFLWGLYPPNVIKLGIRRR